MRIAREKFVGVVAVAVLSFALAGAQTPSLHPDRPPGAAMPTVTFSFALQGATPGHYSIAVDDTGKAAYRADDISSAGSGDPYLLKFEISPATTQRIFEVAKQANYFQGDFEYHGKRLANMGAKTLSYSDPSRQSQASYNYSQNPAVLQLTETFQKIAATLEFGRRLGYEHKYDRLGLEEELKSMVDQDKRGNLSELQAVAPVLQAIANDVAVMNISRHRAQGLLDKAKNTVSAERAAPAPR